MPSLGLTPASGRLALVDVLRGIAIVCMIAYHLAWDLSYLGFWAVDISSEPAWIAFQRSILFTFLFLVGFGLVLGHGETIRWRRFLRRLAFIAAAALAMSIGTYILFEDAFSFFGILHAIVLFSLLGLLFLRLPPVIVVGFAAAVLALGIGVHWAAFNTRWLAWIGFWTVPPRTADLVSVFPWFGVTLLGIVAGRLVRQRGWWARLAALRLDAPPLRVLAFAGRWSLLIYLLHQPLLLGALYPLANWLQPGTLSPPEVFAQQCEPSCIETGGVAGYCRAYCSCALDEIERGNLWDAVNATAPTAEQSRQVDGTITLCRAMAE